MKLYEVFVKCPQVMAKYYVCAANMADAIKTLKRETSVDKDDVIQVVKKVTQSKVIDWEYYDKQEDTAHE